MTWNCGERFLNYSISFENGRGVTLFWKKEFGFGINTVSINIYLVVYIQIWGHSLLDNFDF